MKGVGRQMKIGFIGLGIMGEAMCSNLIKKHDEDVFVYDIEAKKVAIMVEQGAKGCDSIQEVGTLADVIISMVPKSEHAMTVYKALLPVLNETKICIDMSTIHPNVSISISDLVGRTGAYFIDAPVVKSKQAAIEGKLGIYVGGDSAIYEKVKFILGYMGENIKYMGENGKGLVMKICHNALVAQIQNGVNETYSLAMRNGIDMMDFAEAISYGGGQNFYLDSKKRNLANEDFATAFSIENMAKDVGICLDLARASHLAMPGQENVERVYEEAMACNYSQEDFSATIKVVNK